MIRPRDEASERGRWAAFSPDGGAKPYAERVLQKNFNHLIEAAIGKAEADQRSWHALRVTAATALNTAGQPDGMIQAMLRWKTVDAMRLYAKVDRTRYADLVDEISTVDIQVTLAESNPTHDYYEVAEQLEQIDKDFRRMEMQGADAGTGDEEESAGAGTSSQAQQVKTKAFSVDKKRVITRSCGYDDAVVNVKNKAWQDGSGNGAWKSDLSTKCTILGQCVEMQTDVHGDGRSAYVVRASDDGYLYVVSAEMFAEPPIKKKKSNAAGKKPVRPGEEG